jgi:hypothetical protein
MRRAALIPCAGLLLLLSLCPAAGADVFGPISLVSESVNQQAVYAHDPAVSGNGRYVAFDGSYGGQTGVFRRDLVTGAVEPVAAGVEGTPSGSAELPSISESGRYVSFTTTEPLVPGDGNEGPDVYVRDMEIHSDSPCAEGSPPEEPCAFELASAFNGSGAALSYSTPEPSKYGSLASGRFALSADGRRVVFVTNAISNLANVVAAELTTPALQVAVRDLDTDETRLVSVAQGGGPVSAKEGAGTYGAVYASGATIPEFRAPGAYELPSPLGASISADGSTVAWLGQNVSEQTETLPAETLPVRYAEPLWRDIATEGPTRRITGGSDPADPECAASGEGALPREAPTSDPCQGPFLTLADTESPGTWQGRTGDQVPQLSANGSIVAFLSQAPRAGSGTAFQDQYNDLYVANMGGGLSRVQATRPLTEPASANAGDPATTAPIVDFGISPDGSEVAFTTQRTQFPLGSPAYVSAPAAVAGLVELFDVDLSDDTLTRVTQGFEQGPGEHPHPAVGSGQDPYGPTDGALSPSFSADGNTLAFSSTASNLVYGDGNTPQTDTSTTFDGSDAFVVSRQLFHPTPTPQLISPPPPPPPVIEPAWMLSAIAIPRANGTVLLEVEVPGAGTVSARASSTVRIRSAGSSRTARRSTRRVHTSSVAARTVAKATGPSAGGLVSLGLTLSPAYKSLAEQRGGLSSTVSVTFTAAGHPALRESVVVSFRRVVRHASGAAAHRRRVRGAKRR